MIKKRYYHYPSPIAIDRFNTRVLSALSTKLSRDYLGFFGNLAKMYTKGTLKKELDSAVGRVKQSVVLLNNMISMNRVSKDDVKNLINHVEGINVSRDYFISQMEQNKSFKTKVEKISEVTGISSEDLNISKKVIMKGAAQVRKRTKEGVLPSIKREMSGTLELGGELGRGALTAALGPFAPAASMVGTLAKGAWNVGKGTLDRQRLKQEEKLTSRLDPMSRNLQTSGIERLATRRTEHPFVTNFGGISQRTPTPRASQKRSKEELVLPLTYFFDKKAYKTKWTKELLDKFKSIEKKLGHGDTGGGDMLGTIAKIAAGAAVTALTTFSVTKLVGKVSEYLDVRKNVKEHEKKQEVLQKEFRAKEAGTLAKKMIVAKTPVERAAAASQMRVNQKEREKALIKEGRIRITESGGFGRAWETWKSGASSLLGMGGAEEITPKIRGGVTQKEELLEAMPTRVKDPFYSRDSKKDESMAGVQKAVERMHETISRQQSSGVRGAALGDPYGVGDPLILPWSSGQITVESE